MVGVADSQPPCKCESAGGDKSEWHNVAIECSEQVYLVMEGVEATHYIWLPKIVGVRKWGKSN